MQRVRLRGEKSLQHWADLDFVHAAERSVLLASHDEPAELPRTITADLNEQTRISLTASETTGELATASYTLFGTTEYTFALVTPRTVLARSLANNQNRALSPQLNNLTALALKFEADFTPVPEAATNSIAQPIS